MQLKKLLALLLSAALALSLLAGCGGESVARSLLALLDGQYANVSVEMDPDLEADLRQALSETENDDEAAIRAALETLLGSKVTFRKLGEGQQGDTAFDLIFYAGSDPDKAAQAAYSQWNPILSNVPADGQYDTSLAMVETNSGVWMLVKATVEKAGTVDKPDKDDEPDPVTIQGLSATLSNTTYYQGSIFSKSDLTVTATYSNGKQETIDTSKYTATIDGTQADGYRFTTAQEYTVTVSFGGQNATATVEVIANPNGYYQDSDGTYFVTGTDGLQKLFEDKWSDARSATITLTTNQTVTGTFGGDDYPFTGTLQGESPAQKATIKLQVGSNGLFQQIDSKGTVENITFEVQTAISNTYSDGGTTRAGAVAGKNYGNITNCTVTINGSISATGNSYAAAGGLVGWNGGTITDCTVTINGSISATDNANANAGGIAGGNQGKIEGNSQVTIGSGGSIRATGTGTGVWASAGGLAGQNVGTVDRTCSFKSYDLEKTITAQTKDGKASVPDSTDTDTPNTDTQGRARAGAKIGHDHGTGKPVG